MPKAKPRDTPTQYRGPHSPEARCSVTPYLLHQSQCGEGEQGMGMNAW